jgi:hypothetical protein
MAIALALTSPPIQRLELTRRYLKKEAASQLEKLVKLCDDGHEHSYYRKALSEVPDPTYHEYCIPCVGKNFPMLKMPLS